MEVEFSIGDHVQVIAEDHPNYGELGVITGKNDVHYAMGWTQYWFVDLGYTTIHCTDEQLSGSIPTGNVPAPAKRITPVIPEWRWAMDRQAARRRKLDRTTPQGFDFECLHLAPVPNNIDGGE